MIDKKKCYNGISSMKHDMTYIPSARREIDEFDISLFL